MYEHSQLFTGDLEHKAFEVPDLSEQNDVNLNLKSQPRLIGFGGEHAVYEFTKRGQDDMYSDVVMKVNRHQIWLAIRSTYEHIRSGVDPITWDDQVRKQRILFRKLRAFFEPYEFLSTKFFVYPLPINQNLIEWACEDKMIDDESYLDVVLELNKGLPPESSEMSSFLDTRISVPIMIQKRYTPHVDDISIHLPYVSAVMLQPQIVSNLFTKAVTDPTYSLRDLQHFYESTGIPTTVINRFCAEMQDEKKSIPARDFFERIIKSCIETGFIMDFVGRGNIIMRNGERGYHGMLVDAFHGTYEAMLNNWGDFMHTLDQVGLEKKDDTISSLLGVMNVMQFILVINAIAGTLDIDPDMRIQVEPSRATAALVEETNIFFEN